ncbi:5'/3'-nucleotidase SurE [Rhizoctonia solani AG-3 Rhs1AP]|uniref:5'/3'-nucleotidase SurE n=2 Tax=Rhizoctonia solani AG-3 TaxID=1086053 RepID=A0A074S9E8_9AGAM|nr:5'/3'-nucleotidase SurE [Rhizoctonia solani AG-3 Rhs1AP]KEP55814.1 5'/3'-nucleotidase SurE [Rhizoctonia solani 123E]
MSGPPVRVLITNDDGPPAKDSPYVLGLYLELKKLGWDVRVVLPASQKSWIGKAYVIHDVIHGQYFYPKEDGTGEKCDAPRSLEAGEVGEWILLEGTPATCTNIALHNLYPGEIDLVVSGPNFGRNTASAFTLSSGTIGAAMSGALSRMRSIAISYGTFHKPSPVKYNAPAHALAGQIIKRLWENWGTDKNGLRLNEVDLYNVNIPMVDELLQPEGMEVCWTTIWGNSYGRLFKLHNESDKKISRAGPDAPPSTSTTPAQPNISLHNQLQQGSHNGSLTPNQSISTPDPHRVHTPSIPVHLQRSELVFTFSPEMQHLVSPPLDKLPYGTDTWAIHHGKASVTPMRAAFCPGGEGEDTVGGTTWKW